MIYYFLEDFRIIPAKDDLNEPASWMFEVRPLLSKHPPEIHIYRTDVSYNAHKAAEMLNHFKETPPSIGSLSPRVVEKGVLPAMERLVLNLSRKREIILPEAIGKG